MEPVTNTLSNLKNIEFYYQHNRTMEARVGVVVATIDMLRDGFQCMKQGIRECWYEGRITPAGLHSLKKAAYCLLLAVSAIAIGIILPTALVGMGRLLLSEAKRKVLSIIYSLTKKVLALTACVGLLAAIYKYQTNPEEAKRQFQWLKGEAQTRWNSMAENAAPIIHRMGETAGDFFQKTQQFVNEYYQFARKLFTKEDPIEQCPVPPPSDQPNPFQCPNKKV